MTSDIKLDDKITKTLHETQNEDLKDSIRKVGQKRDGSKEQSESTSQSSRTLLHS